MSCPHKHPEPAAAAAVGDDAPPATLEAQRQRMSTLGGQRFWRNLDELADTPAFREYLHREFPAAASEWHDGPSRRNFLKLMGASLALAGVTGAAGCKRDEKIIPYVVPPERLVPGKPLFYATAMPFFGYGVGLLAEQHMGRPTKVEGNPDHPASTGATNYFAQASVLSLYDPDRAQTITRTGQISTWSAFVDMLTRELEKLRPAGGAGLRVLTETVTSPTVLVQLQELQKQFPQAKWHRYDPVGRGNVRAGAVQAFGRPVDTVYRFERAERILSLDSDFLLMDPAAVRYNRDFAETRRVRLPGASSEVHEPHEGKVNDPSGSDTGAGRGIAPHTSGAATQFSQPPAGTPHAQGLHAKTAMSRLYAVESTPTLTGAMADHRWSMRASEVEAFARAVLQQVRGGGNATTATTRPAGAAARDASAAGAIPTIVADLLQHRGASIVIAGDHQPPAVHALAHAINEALGNVGQTVVRVEPADPHPEDGVASIRQLAADMQAGQVDTLLILGANPVYNAPADLDFWRIEGEFDKNPLSKVRLRIHHAYHYEETSYLCDWHVPEAHYLESWGDLRAYDGTAAIVQPLIRPLYEAHSAIEMLSALIGQTDTPPLEVVRNTWRASAGDQGFETYWRGVLEKGVVPNTASAPVQVSVRPDALAATAPAPATAPAGGGEGPEFEVVFRPDPTVFDGRYANNGWLQELPKPITKLTWDNVAYVSRNTARHFRVETDELHGGTQLVRLTIDGRDVEYPVWVVPGHPDNAITVHLGGGRRNAGRVGTGVGFNGYQARPSGAMWIARGVHVRNTGKDYRLANTQPHQMLEGRDNFRVHSIAHLAAPGGQPVDSAHPGAEAGHGEATTQPGGGGGHGAHKVVHLSLYPEFNYEGHAWGMVVDQNVCTGCTACVAACNAENNIPIVGKEEVIKGREMHWLRIDTYYKGEPTSPDGPYFQPMLCQHCEKAPCEVVCPVVATSHSAEGINEMTYNRCIGTRYCSNNCPYKVRRFNFFQYADWRTPIAQLRHNPDVTVRTRGVMEKCTYCVQRVNETRRELKKLNGDVENGAFVGGGDPKDAADRIIGQLQTACQQACPTRAIVFGDINWRMKNGEPMLVTQLKAQSDEYHYKVLDELNTVPRTSYLARVTNPHPDLPPAQRELDEGPRQPHEAARG